MWRERGKISARWRMDMWRERGKISARWRMDVWRERGKISARWRMDVWRERGERGGGEGRKRHKRGLTDVCICTDLINFKMIFVHAAQVQREALKIQGIVILFLGIILIIIIHHSRERGEGFVKSTLLLTLGTHAQRGFYY